MARRRSNYELAHSIEVLLRAQIFSGLTKDKRLAEDLIRDLHERLCPRVPEKLPYSATPSGELPGSKKFRPPGYGDADHGDWAQPRQPKSKRRR